MQYNNVTEGMLFSFVEITRPPLTSVRHHNPHRVDGEETSEAADRKHDSDAAQNYAKERGKGYAKLISVQRKRKNDMMCQYIRISALEHVNAVRLNVPCPRCGWRRSRHVTAATTTFATTQRKRKNDMIRKPYF